MLELIEGVLKPILVVACLYLILASYAARRGTDWSEPFEKRRFSILAMLVLSVCAIAIGEDVVGHETASVDSAILLFLRAHTSPAWQTFFEALTLTGSALVLVPLASIAVIALLLSRRRRDALLVAASLVLAGACVYVLKSSVQRSRPALWDTQWYWGSSFPSGHTLAVAAFATAAALCVIRSGSGKRLWPLGVAFAWTSLVALSRLVLGVHWPTDVLAAACIGAFLPLAIHTLLDWQRR